MERKLVNIKHAYIEMILKSNEEKKRKKYKNKSS